MRVLPLLFLLSGTLCIGAEYRSDGFQAKISPKGVLSNLTFRGEKILNLSQLAGSCVTPPDKPKGKNVVFRQSSAENTTERQTTSDGGTLFRYSGTFTAPTHPDAADYLLEMRFTPHRIQIRTQITLKEDFYSHSHPFAWQFQIPVARMKGRGIRFVEANGVSSDLLLPEIFEQRIKLIGRKVFLAYPADVIYFANVRNATVRFEDNRNWAKQNFHVQTHPDARWNNIAQRIPAGTVLEWSFDIALYDPPEEEVNSKEPAPRPKPEV